MNQSCNKALQYLTGNGNIEVVTIEELETLIKNHPYFSVAHFLLAKKLSNENDPRFLPQVQKTALYFSNPHWLHYQLNYTADEINKQIREEDKEIITRDHPHHSIIIDEEQLQELTIPQTDAAYKKEDSFEELAAAHENKHPLTTEFSAAELKVENKSSGNNFTSTDEEKSDVATTNDTTFTQNPEVLITVNEEKSEETTPQILSTPIEKANDLIEISDSSKQDDAKAVSQPEEEMAALTRETNETTKQFLNELEKQEPEKESIAHTVEDAMPIEEISSSVQPATFTEAEESEPEYQEEQTDEHEEADEHEKMFRNIKAMLDASAKEANADTKNAVLPIDPYYTIDYFASQGIKLDLQKNPDRLGKKVRKFTQWLKHMKKLGPEDALASESISASEVEAQRIADASNTAREVVTEAMALVLEKQGKKDKAIQLYRKLTFLNPDKSAYFASKIKNLNGT